MVLASEIRFRGATPFRQESLVDEESEVKPPVGVSALSFIQCFDTVGWMTGRSPSPVKTCALYLPEVLI